MGVESPPQPHNFVNFGLIWSCVGTFILTTAFNALGGSGAGVPDVFYATVGDISDVYQLFITPAGRDHKFFDIDFHSFLFLGVTFAIWTIIYLWLAVSLLLLVITLFLKTQDGRLDKHNLDLLKNITFISFQAVP